jgi:hypothetical protein
MPIDDVRRLLVIGSGTMGLQNALHRHQPRGDHARREWNRLGRGRRPCLDGHHEDARRPVRDARWRRAGHRLGDHRFLQQLGDPQLRVNAEFLRAYLDRGRTGVKSGAGFYRYPDPAYTVPGFLESGLGE